MPYAPVELIEVRCWGRRVGGIALDDRLGFFVFEYDPAWSRLGVELAPTTMPVGDPRGAFVFPGLPPATFHRLPSMIADSLPDDFGNALTTAYLAGQGVSPEQINALDRLAYLGNRGMGALEFHPMRGPRQRKATAVELSELVVAARSTVAGTVGTDDEATRAIAHLIAVGTSAGGARAKAVVALNPESGELRSGQVPADAGFEHWLVKLDGVGADLDLGGTGHFGRIEFGYSLMARAAGIDMPECRLLEEGGRAHFMARRFDRPSSGPKVHTQTLCALGQLDFRLIGVHDYAQLFLVIDELGLEPDARAEAFRRMVFNVAAANFDDHTKNFSFLLPETGAWQLAPGYDITHAHAPESRWTHEHLMAVNGKRIGIGRQDVDEVGDRFAVPAASKIVEQVLDVVATWRQFAERAGVPQEMLERVGDDIAAQAAPLRKQ